MKTLFLCALLLLLATPVLAIEYLGDLNDDGFVDPMDTILALQIAVGLEPEVLSNVTVASRPKMDVGEDGIVGPVEASYALQVTAGERVLQEYIPPKNLSSSMIFFGSGLLSLVGFRRRVRTGLQRLTNRSR